MEAERQVMQTQSIEPHRVTKPIQLLATWFAGLLLVDGSFLTAAHLLTNPSWLSPLLVIAAVVNVPLFLVSIFVLQTKFRPEMLEDRYYSKHLDRGGIEESQLKVIDGLKEELKTKASELDAVQRSIESESERERPNVSTTFLDQLDQQRSELERQIGSLNEHLQQVQSAQEELKDRGALLPSIAYVRELNVVDKKGRVRAQLTTLIDDSPNLFIYREDGYEPGKDLDFAIALGLDDNDGEAALDLRSKLRGAGLRLDTDDTGHCGISLMGDKREGSINLSTSQSESNISVGGKSLDTQIILRARANGTTWLTTIEDGKQTWSSS
ncbi:MAG: hypothetical protein AABO57_14665 [Acidobacteriota bacterium]